MGFLELIGLWFVVATGGGVAVVVLVNVAMTLAGRRDRGDQTPPDA